MVIERDQRQFLIAQGSVDLFNIIEHVALRHEQIFPAVVVEIFQANAPAGTSRSQRAEAGFKALIAEGALAIVVIQRIEFAWEFGHEYIWASIVVIVLENRAHAGKTFAIGGEPGPDSNAHSLKVPSPLLWKRYCCMPSLATKMSVKPSPS